MLWVWIGLGGVVGVVNSVSILRFVAQIRPSHGSRLRFRILRSYGFRYGLLMLALALAVRRGIVPALCVFGGVWVTRWIPVVLGASGAIDWSRFGPRSRGVN